jgi:hypothetical protein
MKRIEEYTKQLHVSVSNYWMQKSSLWVTQLCGKSGMGKTSLAQSYLEAYGGQYFSFRNLDAAFAPQIFRPGCKLWREFFAEIGKIKNRPVTFFDDVDDRNDKEVFLNTLPELAGKAYVVLIVRNQMSLPFPSDILQMTAVTVPMLLAENKALDPLDALRTIAITDGIPELVQLFDFQRTFAENLGLLFAQNSTYFRYAESELRRHFRTPETYNILLYGMATGHNRISQLAEFSGFPQNKCDKYLKALDKVSHRRHHFFIDCSESITRRPQFYQETVFALSSPASAWSGKCKKAQSDWGVQNGTTRALPHTRSHFSALPVNACSA